MSLMVFAALVVGAIAGLPEVALSWLWWRHLDEFDCRHQWKEWREQNRQEESCGP